MTSGSDLDVFKAAFEGTGGGSDGDVISALSTGHAEFWDHRGFMVNCRYVVTRV